MRFIIDKQCERCGRCCNFQIAPHNLLDFATPSELTRIFEFCQDNGIFHLKIQTKDGNNYNLPFTSPRDFGEDQPLGKAIRHAVNCPFFQIEDKLGSCRIYEYRPRACQKFNCYNLLNDSSD